METILEIMEAEAGGMLLLFFLMLGLVGYIRIEGYLPLRMSNAVSSPGCIGYSIAAG